MIKLLEENPLGMSLAAVCAVLVLVSILLAVVWMIPPSAQSGSAQDDGLVASLDLPELRAIGSIEDYAEITTRPVFNESRQPIIELDDESMDEELLPDDVDAPEVELAGVIITPSLRMATLRMQGEEHSLVAFEGRPLEGDFGTWQISRIEPREVTLSSADGEELKLQLQVHMATITAPAKADPDSAKPAPGKAEREGDQPLSRAEEIRQRIAERREELRQAAESDQSNPQLNYQQSIQSLMRQKSQDNTNNDQ